MDISTYSAIISIAFLGSFSHCVSMCGGFVLSYSCVKIDSSWSKKYQAVMHLLYGFGRTFSYMILGAVFGYLGFVISSLFYKGLLFIVLGVFMVLVGVSFVDKINIFKYIKINILEFSYIKSFHYKTMKSKKPWSFFIFGVLNGFVPCGMVYFFIGTSIISTSVLNGVLGMMIFGLSTIPALFVVGFSASVIKNNFTKIFNYIASLLIIGYGIITFVKGIMMAKVIFV